MVLDGKPVTYYGVAIDEDPTDTYGQPTPVRDPAGRFTQRDVAPGRFAVIIVGPGFARRVVDGVQVVSGRVTELGDIAVTRGDRVHGRVVDARGAGVAGATVRVGSRYSMGSTGLRAIMQGDFSAVADASGGFEIVGQTASADDRQIEATHPAAGTSGIRVLAAGQTELALELTASGSIDGTVARPRAGMHHATASRVDDPEARYDAEVTATGTFRFPQLPPGDYDVRVPSSYSQPAIRATVTAGASTTVAFELPAHPVELRVHVAAGCSLISLRTVSDEMLRLQRCAEGRATFSELAPGAYQLCLELSECRPIEVPATDVHAIEIAR